MANFLQGLQQAFSVANNTNQGNPVSFIEGAAMAGEGVVQIASGQAAVEFARRNADLDMQAARLTMLDAQRYIAEERKREKSVVSSLTASAAARGISQEGTVQATKMQNVLNSRLNQLEISRASAEQAQRLRSSARLNELRGITANRNSKLGAFQSLAPLAKTGIAALSKRYGGNNQA